MSVKILYLITGLRLGGAEKQLSLLAGQMQAEGFSVLVVAMESGGVMTGEITNKGITVIELGMSKPQSLATGYKKFKSAVKNFAPDIIHSHMIHANLFARFFKLFNKQYKVISTAHNIREGGKVLMSGYALTRGIADWSTNVSRESFAFYVQKKYFDPSKSSYLPNAIDTNLFDPVGYDGKAVRKKSFISPDAFVFFTAGRLHAQKNHAMLLQAFARISTQADNAVLLIAGEGPLYEPLNAFCVQTGIAAKVTFLGKRGDMAELMSACDCFVLSSIYEGFGLVAAEALAMEKPVIATDCGGIKEVLNGFGTLVAVNDINGLAEAMLKCYQCKSVPANRQKAREHIQSNYGIPVVVNQWMQLYRS